MTENSKPMIFARIKTHRSWEDEDLFEVLFTAETLPMLTVTVCATDESIAAVEALLHLRKERDMRPYQVKLVRCVTAGADDPDWVTVFSSACNYLLTHHLREENMILVACFLSLCNWNMPGDDLAAIEKELLRQELRCNCVEKTLYHYDYTEAGGAKLTPKQILFRCGHIWTSYLFAESLGLLLGPMVAMEKVVKTVTDPEELLYWTFLLSFYGQYDCLYPYTLFLRIKEDTYAPYIAANQFPELTALLYEAE